MEATLVVKAQNLTPDYVDGITKIFSKDAILNITVRYDLQSSKPEIPQIKQAATQGKKRGPKPKSGEQQAEAPSPKKRGRKPKVAVE